MGLFLQQKMEEYSKYDFSAVNFKKSTAIQFRLFSKKIATSNTETLAAMLRFFEIHQLSPFDSVSGSLHDLERNIKKRINASIAIIKQIEKQQTKPTAALLQSLFEEKMMDDEPVLMERKLMSVKEEIDNDQNENTVSKITYDKLYSDHEITLHHLDAILKNIVPVKSNFGKPYLKLVLTEDEIVKIKSSLNNIA